MNSNHNEPDQVEVEVEEDEQQAKEEQSRAFEEWLKDKAARELGDIYGYEPRDREQFIERNEQ